jgi:mono/diheme cytochrome c family protein
VTLRGRNRAFFLASALLVTAVILVACGRASKDEINAALGITPTATMNADDQAKATEQAISRATEQAAVAGGATPNTALDTTDLAQLGSVQLGRTTFAVQCQRCHSPTGTGAGGALVGSTSPTVALNDTQIYNLLKVGTGHDKTTGGPGALPNITDKQIYDIIAFIRDQETK